METQDSIEEWRLSAFGPLSRLEVGLARANLEMAELITEAAGNGDPDRLSVECADVAICLCQVSQQLGFDQTPLMNVVMAGRTGGDPPLRSAIRAGSYLLSAIDYATTDRHMARAQIELVLYKLNAICRGCGVTLGEAIDAKMIINRRRKWQPKGDGTGSHIKA